MGLLIRGLKSQHVHFPRSNPHCMVEGEKSGNFQGTIPGLCLPIGAPTIHGGRGNVRHLFSAPAQACFSQPNCPCHFFSETISTTATQKCDTRETPEILDQFVFIYPMLSELLQVRGGQGDGDPLQVGTTCEVFQAFIIKTKVCSQLKIERIYPFVLEF